MPIAGSPILAAAGTINYSIRKRTERTHHSFSTDPKIFVFGQLNFALRAQTSSLGTLCLALLHARWFSRWINNGIVRLCEKL